MSDSYVYTVRKHRSGDWVAETEVYGHRQLTLLSRVSYSPFEALRHLMQAIDELEPLEAKIEEGEA